eukprot:g12910.t1
MRRADLVVRTNEENTEATMGRWAVEGQVVAVKSCIARQERVAVYKDYDAAFKFLMEASQGRATRAIAWLYPFVVKKATGRFQGLSQSVRSLASELETRSETARKPLASQVDEAAESLRALQRMEAPKGCEKSRTEPLGVSFKKQYLKDPRGHKLTKS